MNFPRQIQNLVEAFERLPGIGPKTAERLTFYLLHVPDQVINELSQSVANLKKGINYCQNCKNITNLDTCEICSDPKRDHALIAVVENPLDVFSLEKTNTYHGCYHVLHGVINPLNNIGPDELYIQDLLARVSNKSKANEIMEIILALNPTMEGEATAMYIAREIRVKNPKLKITRLGMGMPTGGDIQYADDATLTRALEGRRIYE